MRVLYVDDDRINALLFEETCRVAGDIEVLTAMNGEEALAIVRESPPDLLVIDLHLPDTNGYELLPQLRRAAALAQTPAFLCTADDAREVSHRALDAGFQGCWNKPVDLAAVIAELARLRASPPAAP